MESLGAERESGMHLRIYSDRVARCECLFKRVMLSGLASENDATAESRA